MYDPLGDRPNMDIAEINVPSIPLGGLRIGGG